ncbi:MAG TPA: type II toxin-antitoxin system Phd/YefM family antitoxin [Pirellulaceae bacterium]|nr:type II toxin-antitoxin system Phd/YefM family antitoxin [Pirellulaceae bacterium]
MKVVSLAEMKAKLSSYVDECRATGPVVITRNGRAAAVLVAPHDDDHLEMMLIASSPKFQAMLAKSRKSLNEGKGIPSEEFWKMVNERSKARAASTKARKRKPA